MNGVKMSSMHAAKIFPIHVPDLKLLAPYQIWASWSSPFSSNFRNVKYHDFPELPTTPDFFKSPVFPNINDFSEFPTTPESFKYAIY